MGMFYWVCPIFVTFLLRSVTFLIDVFELEARMPNTCPLNPVYHAFALRFPDPLFRSVRMVSPVQILPSLCNPMQGKARYASAP